MAISHQAENMVMEKFVYIINYVLKFCADHILIKFFFGYIVDIQKNFKTKRQETALLNADRQLNAILMNIVDARDLCVHKAKDVRT